jgi:hypothetical protein
MLWGFSSLFKMWTEIACCFVKFFCVFFCCRNLTPWLARGGPSWAVDRNRELPSHGPWFATPRSSCWMRPRQPWTRKVKQWFRQLWIRSVIPSLNQLFQKNSNVPQLIFLFIFFYYSYVYTMLGSFLPLAPTLNLPPKPSNPAETILPLSLILLKREYTQ